MQAYPPYIFLGSEIKRAFFSMKLEDQKILSIIYALLNMYKCSVVMLWIFRVLPELQISLHYGSI